MNFRLLLILPVLAHAAGCSDDKNLTDSSTSAATETTAPTTTDASTTEPTTDGTTSPTDPPPACACIDTEGYGAGSYECPTDGGCGPVEAFCDVEMAGEASACAGFGAFSVDEVALDCTLDRLIAGETGLVWWEIDSNGPGFSGGFVDVIGNRSGIGRAWDFYDLSGTETPAGDVVLKDAAYFETCKAAADPEQKFLCMKAWWNSPPAATCDAAGEVSDA